MRRIISVLLENQPGALSRVVGLFSQRGYNIESLNVAPTEDVTLSRLTLTTIGDDQKIEQITKLGMSGEITFSESVKKRFELASPSLGDIDKFINDAMPSSISSGFKALFTVLNSFNIDIWIISGGLKKVIQPFAAYLGVEKEKIIALEGRWDSQGDFIEVICSQAEGSLQ